MRKHIFLSTAVAAFVCISAAPASFARPMTETDLVSLKRIAAPAASPDGNFAVYQLRETDLAANKGRTDLYLVDTRTPEAPPVKIASKGDSNEHSPAFSPDGKFLFYISNEGGSDQIWRVATSGENAQKISAFKADVAGFKLSPNGQKMAIWGDIARDCATFGCDGDGDRSRAGPGTGREYDALFVRHWDAWETPGNYSRIFTFDLGADGTLSGLSSADGNVAGAGAVTGDAPSKPFGGGEEIGWSADNETVYFTLRLADAAEPSSTNLDIYAAKAGAGAKAGAATENNAPVNVTQANLATDTTPTLSPDGKYLAYTAMARAGYEADRLAVHLTDLVSGKTRVLTQDWDRSVGSITWALDSKSLYVTAGEILDTPIFQIDLKGRVKRLTQAGHVSAVLAAPRGALIYAMDSIHAPTELFRRDAKGTVTQLTNVNGDALAQIDGVTLQRFSFAGANGDIVWGQIVKPSDAKTTLPTALIVHGGPQGSFGNSWSYRWNPKVMAAQGLAVVSIDFHGSTGYGQAFTDSINKDWGGKPMEDLRLGMDAAARFDGQVDGENACALGGSYGGYMMNWIAGNMPGRFKCLVSHAGIFDLRAMAYETEELWFDQWDNGGNWIKRTDAEKWNPVNHVARWKTPMLVIHGEKDYRIPYSQSLATFTALQQQGVPSKLLIFPDENHWILKPNNSIQWHRNVFSWLDKYLRK